MTAGCACHAGLVDFDWFEDTCDECCEAMTFGDYSVESHGHAPSAEQQAALDAGRAR
jgi:hypothetical protein